MATWHKLKYQNQISSPMPTCAVCGKEVQPDAAFCPSCGSNLHTNAPQIQPMNMPPQPMQARPIMPMTAEERLANMVKRLERVSYITAGAAGILLIIIILLLI